MENENELTNEKMEEEEEMEVTPETMEEAQDSAIEILNSLSSQDPRIDFIALMIAKEAYKAATPFPTKQLRRFDRKIHQEFMGGPIDEWEEMVADPELAEAVAQYASELGLTDLLR